MQRRKFLRGAAVGGAALTLGACSGSAPAQTGQTGGGTAAAQAPGQAQELPSLEWKMATSWPPALDTIFGGAQTVSDRVKALTNGRFNIRPYAGGELAPATQVLDVVQQGAAEMGHTASYYYTGKAASTAFGTALPFGLTAQQQNAFLYEGGGLTKLQEIYAAKFNTIQFPAGNTGTQMGGWFKREITTLADMQGLKMRIPGLAGEVMKRLGVVTQTLPGGEIFQALDTGAIDAAEWVGPYDDLKLKLNEAADFYYYPGWWEPGSSLEVQINLDKWNSLPVEYQEIIKVAAFEANMTMLSKYEARNRQALDEILSGGTKLVGYSEEILGAAEAEAFKYYDELAAQDAEFKSVYDPWKEFRTGVYSWNKTNETSFANFVYSKLEA